MKYNLHKNTICYSHDITFGHAVWQVPNNHIFSHNCHVAWQELIILPYLPCTATVHCVLNISAQLPLSSVHALPTAYSINYLLA